MAGFNRKIVGLILFLLRVHLAVTNTNKWYDLDHLSDEQKFYPALYYEQKLDHSNPSDLRTFQQRYMVNEEYFEKKSDGPAFLYISGEGLMNGAWMKTQQPIKYAEKYNGLFFQLEHRYYGLTGPIRDNTTKSLQYLTSNQALSDLAQFIVAMSEKYNISSEKWVTIGGSYAGNLATWMRYKFPHLVAGSVAASAPVLAQVDFSDYLEIVETVIRNRSESCGDHITLAFQEIDEKMQTKLGRFELRLLFLLPISLDKIAKNPYYNAHFFETWTNLVSEVVQYNRDNTTVQGIDFFCDIMNNPNHSPLENFAHFFHQDHKQQKQFSKNDLKINLFATNWVFETCNEFGYFQCSSPKAPMFGDNFPLEFKIEDCTRGFGDEYSEDFIEQAVERTNADYGGLKPVGLTNVISVHGSIDPWHVLGFAKDLNDYSPTIIVEGASHCQVLMDSMPNEVVPPQLADAQKQILETIGTWIN